MFLYWDFPPFSRKEELQHPGAFKSSPPTTAPHSTVKGDIGKRWRRKRSDINSSESRVRNGKCFQALACSMTFRMVRLV